MNRDIKTTIEVVFFGLLPMITVLMLIVLGLIELVGLVFK